LFNISALWSVRDSRRVTRIASTAVRWRPINGYFPWVFDAIASPLVWRCPSPSAHFDGINDGISLDGQMEIPSWD
jgi:hypothetical protein